MPVNRNNNKESLVFVLVMIPHISLMNLLIFGTCIFDSFLIFMKGFGLSAFYFFIIYGIFSSVAGMIKNRYPKQGDLFRQLLIMLPVFYLMSIGALYGAYFFFRSTTLLECDPNPDMIWWTILYSFVTSTGITLIHKGDSILRI